MAKSKIIKELANNTISLEVALSRLLVIASDIDNEELQNWAESELNGYTSDNLPNYRISKNLMFRYSGINGSFKVTNQPLQVDKILGISQKHFYMNIPDGIKAIEDMMKNPQSIYSRDLSWVSGDVYEKTGIQCFSITQQVPFSAIEQIVNSLRTLLLKIFIKLDKTYGSLDEMDIDTDSIPQEKVSATNVTINKYIHIDNSVKVGDRNTINDTNINT